MSDQPPIALENGAGEPEAEEPGALEVFRNRPFLLLWLSQLFTQIGGNMVLYGLTVIVLTATGSNTAVSLLILTFLGPAVLFSAVAGVYVDRLDKRLVLIVTNAARAGLFVLLFLAGDFLPVLLLLNAFISTVTVFFAPAEAAMIPTLVPKRQLTAANGVFTITLNAAFAVGYALLGGVVVALLGAPVLILLVAACYLMAAGFCWTLPSEPPVVAARAQTKRRLRSPAAEQAMGSTFVQLREGIAFIRANQSISWSLVYLGTAASLIGVLAVLGPKFAAVSLGLAYKDFAVVVLPLGVGVVGGILVLNSFGHLLPRRRIIEGGLVSLGIFVMLIVAAAPIAKFLQKAELATGLMPLADFTSLLAIVEFIALLAGVAYAFVAIPSQTQLQEDIPEDTRGRVFGVLNMLVSVSSFLPIIIAGTVSDLIGTSTVLLVVAIAISASGVLSIVKRGPLNPTEARATAHGPAAHAGLDPVAVATASELGAGERRAAEHRRHAEAAEAADAAEAAEAAGLADAAEAASPRVSEADAGGPAGSE